MKWLKDRQNLYFMSVKFHPHSSIDQLETIITKEDNSPLHGEINIYRKLHEDLSKSEHEWDVWHDLKLPEHSDNFNYYKKNKFTNRFSNSMQIWCSCFRSKGRLNIHHEQYFLLW